MIVIYLINWISTLKKRETEHAKRTNRRVFPWPLFSLGDYQLVIVDMIT